MSICILGIDPGLTPGVCITIDGDYYFSAYYDTPSNLPIAARLWTLWNQLKELIDSRAFDAISLEDISVVRPPKGKFNNHNFCTSGIYTLIVMHCYKNGIRLLLPTPNEVKLHFTGKGNAKKDQMILRAKEICPVITNPNEADALAISLWGYNHVGHRNRKAAHRTATPAPESTKKNKTPIERKKQANALKCLRTTASESLANFIDLLNPVFQNRTKK